MPELPEVEIIRRGLEQLIVGAEITDVDVRLPKMVIGEVESIKGAKIQQVRRRGKGLLIDLNNGFSLAVHVKMTGQLIYQRVSRVPKVSKVSRVGSTSARDVKNLHPKLDAPLELPNKHTHVIFTLRAKGLGQSETEEATLYYNDIRQFGWIRITSTVDADLLPFFKSLGPEPLTNLDLQTFTAILSRSKAPVKQILMDQSRLAGVGNIYANDALFRARIHPLRPANELTEQEVAKLFEAVEYVLTEGIKAGGASENTYLNAFGEKGFYQERFLVYNRTGTPCQVCGTPIERIVVSGRGTFYCPSCQI